MDLQNSSRMLSHFLSRLTFRMQASCPRNECLVDLGECSVIVYDSRLYTFFSVSPKFWFLLWDRVQKQRGRSKRIDFRSPPFPRVHSFLLRFYHRVEGLCKSKIVFDFFF